MYMNELYFLGGVSQGVVFILVMLLVIWTVAWKGIALWKSARSSHRNWFIALLIINTVGILDILYIYVFSKKKTEEIQSTDSVE